MKIKLFAILRLSVLSLVITSCLLFDKDGPKPDEIFIKYYGGEGADELVALGHIPSNDTYVLLGNTNSFSSSGLSDIYLLQTRSDGTPVSDPFIIGTDSSSDISASMKILDNGILIVGSTENRSSSGLFDPRKTFYAFLNFDLGIESSGTIDSLGVDLTGNDILRSQDGNYAVLCTTGETSDDERDLYYVKIDIDGNILWQRITQIPGKDIGKSIVELGNGDMAICAQTERASVRGYGGTNALYLVVNELGFLKNALAYGVANGNNLLIEDIPTKMIADATGATMIGNSNINGEQHPFVLPLTNFGAVDSLRVIPEVGGQTNIEIVDIARALNGDYLMVGNFLDFQAENELDKGQQIMFLRTNQLGTSNLSNNHLGDGFDDSGNAVLQLPDGQILIGATVSFGGSVTKMAVAKVNKSGELLK